MISAKLFTEKNIYGIIKQIRMKKRRKVWITENKRRKGIIKVNSNIDDPNFIPNPAGSVIEKNIVFSTFSSLGHIDDDVYKYSSIGNNKKYFSFMHDYMFGSVNSNEYALKYGNFLKNMVEELKGIPFETIGRIY